MKRFKSILLSLAAVVLGGCATAPQNPDELAATQGFVQVVIPQFGPMAPLEVRSVTDRSSYHLQALPEGDGTLHGLWLPPGRYKLGRWIQSVVMDSPVFEVRSGHLTDLGTLAPIALGGKEMALLPVRDAESARLARQAARRLHPHLAAADVLTWETIDLPKPFVIDPGYTGLGLVADLLSIYIQDVNQTPIAKRLRESKSPGEMLALAKEAAAPRTKEPAIDDQGRLYFGAVLGQVRVRTPTGVWSAIDTKSLRAVTAVEWHEGLLVVGDEAGEIRATRDQGRTWTKLASIGPRAAVADIDHVGRHWVVLAAGHRPGRNGMFEKVDRISAHVATRDDLADLKQVWEGIDQDVHIVAPNWNGVRGEATAKGYLFAAYFALMRLDLANSQVRQVPAPVGATGLHVSPGGIVTAFQAMGAFSKLYVSADDGETWTARDAPSLVIDDVIFDAPDRGLATRWPMAAFKPRVVFETYDGASKKWVPRDAGPEACQLILQDARKQPNFCVTGSGSVLFRSDTGWGVEFSAE
jgi:hypothetical protein